MTELQKYLAGIIYCYNELIRNRDWSSFYLPDINFEVRGRYLIVNYQISENNCPELKKTLHRHVIAETFNELVQDTNSFIKSIDEQLIRSMFDEPNGAEDPINYNQIVECVKFILEKMKIVLNKARDRWNERERLREEEERRKGCIIQ